MEILFVILVLLLVARALGEVAARFGQPTLVGELVAGILIGLAVTLAPDGFMPELVHLFRALPGDEAFHLLVELGMFFIMLSAGVELSPRELTEVSGKATLVAMAGFALPFSIGFGLGLAVLPESDLRLGQCLYLGTALSVTAVPVSIRVLMEIGKLSSLVGRMIVSAAVIDDVLSLFVLTLLVGLIAEGGAPDALTYLVLAGKVALFFGLTGAIGYWLFPFLGRHIAQKARAPEIEFSAVLIAAFAFGVLAEIMGLHFILGGFMAGLFFGRKTMKREVYDDVRDKVGAITTGFLAPIFFTSIGLQLNFGALLDVPWLVGLVLLTAVIGKIVGAGGAARLAGFDGAAAGAIGIGMSGRGAVDLIIANIALSAGLFALPEDSPIVANLYSAVVLSATLITLATPVSLRWVMLRLKAQGHPAVKGQPGKGD